MTVSEFPTPAEKYPDQEQWNEDIVGEGEGLLD